MKRILRLVFLFLAGILFFNSSAGALSIDQRKTMQSGVYYFNLEENEVCNVGEDDADLIGSDNPEKAYRYFVQKGLKDFQSAGIVGNLMQESGVDPKSNQEGGPGRGIAQWSEGGRWDVLINYAEREGRDPESLSLQLDFIWYEMNEIAPWNETLPAIKATTTVEDATRVFEEKYEKAGTPNMENRIKYAKKILQLYGGGTSSETSSSDGCQTVGDGKNTQYIDGFTIYSQHDPAWADKPYGKGNISDCGCGPTAMASIITTLTGNRVTPVETSKYAAENGQQDPTPGNCGSMWTIGSVLAEHWGLKAKHIGTDLDKIVATLRSGGVVFGSGRGPAPFTEGGHFIVIRGITDDGKFMVADSNRAESNEKEWEPDFILTYMNDGSTYAISK